RVAQRGVVERLGDEALEEGVRVATRTARPRRLGLDRFDDVGHAELRGWTRVHPFLSRGLTCRAPAGARPPPERLTGQGRGAAVIGGPAIAPPDGTLRGRESRGARTGTQRACPMSRIRAARG